MIVEANRRETTCADHHEPISLWAIPIAITVGCLIPLLQGKTGMGLFENMLEYAGLGMVIAMTLIVRSYVRSAFWANAFIIGLMFVGIVVCIAYVVFIIAP